MRIGIVLHEHQADERRMWAVGEIIRRVGLEMRVPITFSMSGMTIDAIVRHCPDIAAGIRWDFANALAGWDPKRPELVVSSQHNNPLILPWLPLEYWGTYFDHFAALQIAWSKGAAEKQLHRTPRGFFPPEMIFAPAAAHVLERAGMEYCLIPGEPFLDDSYAKGKAYCVPGTDLTLLPRSNEFAIGKPHNWDAYRIKDDIRGYLRAGNLGHAIVGCDLGEFTGLYHYEGRGGIPLNDGIARLICLRDAIESDPDLELVNCGAIADASHFPESIHDCYGGRGFPDPHHYVTTWMNCAGNLDGVHRDEAECRSAFVTLFCERMRQGECLWAQRDEFFANSGMERMMDW